MILLTGASGFVGSAVLQQLKLMNTSNIFIRTYGRSVPIELEATDTQIVIEHVTGEIASTVDYSTPLNGIKTVIHCAALTHRMDDIYDELSCAYRDVNALGTLKLASQAADAGVERFIFISSIKVNGEGTLINNPYTADSTCNPQDSYGKSKLEAEQLLLKLGLDREMEIVIIRPPLIYGPGVKANFETLLNLASKGYPLPFCCFNKNARSMVSLDNLVSLIVRCINHPKAANQIFLVSDDNDLSTAEMISKLSKACGKPRFMFPIPIILFKVIAGMLGKANIVERLAGSLQVDIVKTKNILDWIPPQSVEDGFKKTADAFLARKNK